MNKSDNNKNIFGEVSLFGNNETDFFKIKTIDIPQKSVTKKSKYINDFDSDLILENIDKKTKNKAVKINLKINAIERTLTKVNEELSVIQLLNLEKDAKRNEELTELKNFLEHKLKRFKRERRNFGILYSVVAFFNNKFDFSFINKYKNKLISEVKKYDKAAISYIKSKHADLLPFKW